MTRFHGSADIHPSDPIAGFVQLVENVIEPFMAQHGTGLKITIDIEARHPEGFGATLRRDVSETATVLKMKVAEFEEE